MVKKAILFTSLALLMVVGAGPRGAHSQFIEDDELYSDEGEKKKEEKDGKSMIPGHVAFNLSAQRMADMRNAIRVSWDVNPTHLDDYLVLRSPFIIDTPEKALKAKIVKTMRCDVNNVFIDSDCPPGQYFYAVIMKKKHSLKGIELFRDVNFTAAPVTIVSPDSTFIVSNFRASEGPGGASIQLKWKKADRNGLIYNVYRSQSVIDSEQKIKTAEKIAMQADIEEYVDSSIPLSGLYYYMVSVRELNGREGLVFVPDQNYNTIGVQATVGPSGQYRPSGMDAAEGARGISVTWSYSGSKGGRNYYVLRTPRQITSVNEITREMIAGDVDITARRFTDRPRAAGDYFYALVPHSYAENRDYRFVPGVNITRTSVRASGAYDSSRGDGDLVTGEVDDILKKTFFIGRYNLAIRSLNEYLRSADAPASRAKANLFIGRSYIEKRMYRRAMDYLCRDEVRKYYPREARFWYDYAVARIPTRKR